MKDKIFSGEALEEALKGHGLEQSEIELIGMVKSSEKSGHIAFARGGCETWVDIPTEMIDQAERLGQRKCKDHSHPQFRIALKKPNSTEARILGELLTTSSISFPGAASGMPVSNAPPTGAIWGGTPPRMSPSRGMTHLRQGGGGGGVFGGGLGFGNEACALLPVCRYEIFADWIGKVCHLGLCCWHPDAGWICADGFPPDNT